jgi:uncharacterized membrane protein YecN with MAPEG domain
MVGGSEEGLRRDAIKRLKRKREFRGNVVTYLFVNAILWAIWALTGAEINDTVPWPTWVSGIWGVILVLHGWRAYGERAISEQDIQEEMGRIRRP